MSNSETLPVACQPDAIPPGERAEWLELGKRFYHSVEELRELEDGYAFRVPGDPVSYVTAVEYVRRDRLCCAFVHWTLIIEPAQRGIWLEVRGPSGTKELTRDSLEKTTALRKEVAEAAGIVTTGTRELTLDTIADFAATLSNRTPA